LQALLDNADDSYEIVALITDQPSALAISRAAQHGVAVAVLPLHDFADRPAWNQAMSDAIDYYQPDLVVSAGFMRVLGEPVVSAFSGKLINTHPALLPLFPGAHAVRDALAAGAAVTGTTVHFIDAGVDTGPVIAQKQVAIESGDDEETLHERIKIVERALLVDVVKNFAAQQSAGES
jgi:phosphoribosylglycinamide formyltransferase-1